MYNQVNPIQSIFGKCKIQKDGYFHIISRKEGNMGKLLHRLIYERFYDVKLPKEIHVHHIDGNKTNNCICNLEALTKSEHHKIHMIGENNPSYGKRVSEKTRMKLSKAHNTSGYYRVHKSKDKCCKQGFIWTYQYYGENGKTKKIRSVNIDTLEEKVKSKGLPWIKLEKEAINV